MEYSELAIAPQLCSKEEKDILADTSILSNYTCEIKFDGTRILPHIGSSIKLFTRNGKSELSDHYPEIISELKSLNIPQDTILDGELVFIDSNNEIQFQSALITNETIKTRNLTPVLILFDILKYNGELQLTMHIQKRRKLLSTIIPESSHIKLSKVYYDSCEFKHIFDSEIKKNHEGIVLKQNDSEYLPNKRNSTWIKIKKQDTIDCVIMGITEGTGKYADTFGALILGNMFGNNLRVIGYCSGMTDDMRNKLYSQIMNMEEVMYNKKFSKEIKRTVKPILVAEIEYMEQTQYMMLRHPRFIQLREDKTIEIPPNLYHSVPKIPSLFEF